MNLLRSSRLLFQNTYIDELLYIMHSMKGNGNERMIFKKLSRLKPAVATVATRPPPRPTAATVTTTKTSTTSTTPGTTTMSSYSSNSDDVYSGIEVFDTSDNKSGPSVEVLETSQERTITPIQVFDTSVGASSLSSRAVGFLWPKMNEFGNQLEREVRWTDNDRGATCSK